MNHPPQYDILVSAHRSDPAVSPVVGIMLMLTITLILAAIISGMTGGIAKTQQKPPQLVFEASMVNDSSIAFLDIRIISVSEGIPTKDLKFQTEWSDQSGVHRSIVIPGQPNDLTHTFPLGFGPGVNSSPDFGNFTILAGTRLNANTSLESSDKNPMISVLSDKWGSIAEGTPIRIQFIHIPSGAIIADKEITAEV